VTWTIDSSQSKLSLKISDTPFAVDGIGNVTLRVRNQNTSQNNAWNTGNTASIGGTIDTNYVDGTSIQFLSGQTNVVGVNSGNYRPNPAAYTGDTNPDPVQASGGSFSNTSTAAAVFGARVRVSALGGLVNADGAFINFFGVNYELSSGVLGLAGTNSPFANTTTVGIQSSYLAVDGLTVLGQQVVDDQIGAIANATAANTGAAGTLADLGGQLRRITIPILLNLVIPLDDEGTYTLTAQATGTIVATAEVPIIPEPSTLAMAGIGVVGLAFAARRKIAKRRA
jgi:hypothetical protein